MKNTVLNEIKNILNQNDFPEEPEFSAAILKSRDIIIYGCGSGFVTLSMFVLNRHKIVPSIVLDKKFTEPELKKDILFRSPDGYDPDTETLEKSLVIVTLGSAEARNEITCDLKKMGFRHVISAMDIYEYHLPNPDERIFRGFSFYQDNCRNILEALELFNDDKSREIFKQFLFTHIYRKCMPIPCDPLENQYFPFDLWDNSVYRRSVICGAYNGDTATAMVRKAAQIESLVCLEPDPANFDELKKNIKPYRNRVSDLLLLPLGVYEKSIQMRFAADNQSNSVISQDGNLLIQCIALDDCLSDIAPTFISMDIEGSEMFALKGMKEIIKNNHPKLAICVYHSPEHIWEIPLFLQSLVPEYKFYLRNYTSFSSETVLYAD